MLDPILCRCFLCEQSFVTLAELEQHGQSSIEHEVNLEEYLKKISEIDTSSADNPLLWFGIDGRDRAAERRLLLKTSTPYDARDAETSRQTAGVLNSGEENSAPKSIGEKLLEKFGWSKGQGLGSASQGIAEPIQAIRSSVKGAGLGAADLETITHHH